MHRLLSFYSQNKLRIWGIIIAVIFILAIIQVLNNIYRDTGSEGTTNTAENVSSYSNESTTVIDQQSVPDQYQEGFGTVIDDFFTACINHQPELAYDYLAPDTINVLYPTESQFESLYYENKFEGNKKYSFQAWSSDGDTYIYQVRIFDDMLSTGIASNTRYIEDYVTIVPVDDTYKLNINSYIGKRDINKKNSNEVVTIEASSADAYLDYEIYSFNIKNNTNQVSRLDTQQDPNTMYVMDSRDNRFFSYTYELASEDLTLEPQEFKTIQIKFNDVYHSGIQIDSVNFTDIVDTNDNKYSLQVELE